MRRHKRLAIREALLDEGYDVPEETPARVFWAWAATCSKPIIWVSLFFIASAAVVGLWQGDHGVWSVVTAWLSFALLFYRPPKPPPPIAQPPCDGGAPATARDLRNMGLFIP